MSQSTHLPAVIEDGPRAGEKVDVRVDKNGPVTIELVDDDDRRLYQPMIEGDAFAVTAEGRLRYRRI